MRCLNRHDTHHYLNSVDHALCRCRHCSRQSDCRHLEMRFDGRKRDSSRMDSVGYRDCWQALRLALWFNENSDFYYQYLHGDKETFHLAFRKLKRPYCLVPKPMRDLDHTMCQHDFNGRRIFQHRNTAKWSLLRNTRIEGFRHERECRQFVSQLRHLWPAGVREYRTLKKSSSTGWDWVR